MSPPAPDTDDDASAAPDDGLDRRRLVRWIAALAFGVPLLLELVTFGGLVGRSLLPGDAEPSEASPSIGTETAGSVGVGDDLLPETATAEIVRRSEVQRRNDGSLTYVLRIEVDNDTDQPVELVLKGVLLRSGRTVRGVSRSGTVPPGATGEVTGAWTLPAESLPEEVLVRALVDGDVVVERSVPVDRPPIRG